MGFHSMIFPPHALVLVCYIPAVKDLEIARMLGWYRIPLKSAPKVIEVDYLAFYQGGNFGEDHRWQIEFFAEYRGHELTTRGELLRDEKDHVRAKEEYFKVQIAQLQHLANPVKAITWKRLTFLYTTGQLMNQALTVNDLVVHDEERSILWKALRERTRNSSYVHSDKLDNYEVDPALIQLILGLNGSLPEIDLDDY
jgi:hypothetical protein